MKQTITCEIEIPDAWEFSRFGLPKIGEHYVEASQVLIGDRDFEKAWKIIVRRAFVWPSWLKCAAIAKDKDGRVGLYRTTNLVRNRDIQWVCTPGNNFLGFMPDCIDIDLADVPWEQSLRINPNYKAE